MPFPISSKKFFIPRFVVSSEGLQRKSKKERKKIIPYRSPVITMPKRKRKKPNHPSFTLLSMCFTAISISSLVSYMQCWLLVTKEEAKTFPIHTWCIFITAAQRCTTRQPFSSWGISKTIWQKHQLSLSLPKEREFLEKHWRKLDK